MREAQQLFAERGFHATPIDEISRRAGFTRGAFYANFEDKADIFLTVLEARRALTFRELDALIADTPDEHVLALLGQWMVRVLVDDPLADASAEFGLFAAKHPAHRVRLQTNQTAITAAVASMVGRYRSGHGIALVVDDSTFAVMVVATFTGFAQLARVRGVERVDEELGMALTCLWTGALLP